MSVLLYIRVSYDTNHYFYGIWGASESSDGQHFSCYEKEVGRMPQRRENNIDLLPVLMPVLILYLDL